MAAGILERRPYREPGRRSRHSYHLTATGLELLPVLGALMQWGNAHLAGEPAPPSLMRHRQTGERLRVAFVDADGQLVEPSDVDVIPGPGATAKAAHAA